MKTRFMLCLLALLPTLPVIAQPSPTQAPTPRVNARMVQSMVNRVLKETSTLRQLSIKRPVRSGVQTRAQVEAMIKRQVQASGSADEIAASQLFLTQLGLAPANFNLKAATTQLLGEQIAGFYDPQTGAFYTSDRIAPAELETVMAHELTHALQDQHFDLKRLDKWPHHESDSREAMTALVEGDATLVMTRYMAQNPLRLFGMMMSALKPQSDSATFRSSPRAMREMLLFPYIQGMNFTTNLYRQGNWSAVSNAFSRVPQSTQQVLHFDKYLAGKAPVEVALRDVRPQLGANWKLLDHDVNGEEGSVLVLGEFLSDHTEVENATKGWAGDRFAVYRGPKSSALVVQDTLWDNASAAKAWRDAYAKRTALRFGKRVTEQQRGVLSVWNAAPYGVWLQQKGRRVLILEGTVGAFSPARVFAALGSPLYGPGKMEAFVS